MERTNRRRIVRRVGVGLVLGMSVLGTWRIWPRERFLTDMARPVMKVNPEKVKLAWLSNRELLLVSTEREATQGAKPGSEPGNQNWRGSADIFQIDNGIRTHLSGLTNILERKTVFPLQGLDEFHVSPDGLWISWRNDVGWPVGSCLHVASRDGAHYRDWKFSGEDESFFLDSRHFVQLFGQNPKMIVRDLLDATKDRSYSKLQETTPILKQHAVRQPFFISMHYLTDSRGNELTQIDTFRTEDQYLYYSSLYDPKQKTLPPFRTPALPVPLGGTEDQQELSPQQQAIFYHIRVSRLSPVLAGLHRLLPKFNPKPIVMDELWVSRIDGQGMREIGHVPAGTKQDGQFYSNIEEAQWLPDGKRVSFVYKGTLFVVTAEPARQ